MYEIKDGFVLNDSSLVRNNQYVKAMRLVLSVVRRGKTSQATNRAPNVKKKIVKVYTWPPRNNANASMVEGEGNSEIK